MSTGQIEEGAVHVSVFFFTPDALPLSLGGAEDNRLHFSDLFPVFQLRF